MQRLPLRVVGRQTFQRRGLLMVVSILSTQPPTNIAEGCGREGEAELGRFFQIAAGSASELEYEVLLAGDLGFLEEGEYDQLSEGTIEVKRMLTAFSRKLKADS